jgi:hypothetical protein
MKIRKFDNFDHLNENNDQGGGNKFILMRFGNTPDPRVTQFFAEGAAIKNPFAMKGPGSIITVFESPLTKEALVQGFDALGISYNLYQVVHTSAGGSGPHMVARKPNKEQLKQKLEAAIAAERWEEAAKLRDQIAELSGHPATPAAPATGAHESKVYSFRSFLYEKEEEEDYVNGTNPEEFYKLVSQLVDHELEELETEDEAGITKEACQKIKDYMVQNKYYVEPEKKEEGDKKEGAE